MKGQQKHSKYLFIHTYTYERIHLDFINCIHNHSSISPREGSRSTINIYSNPHMLCRVPWTARSSNQSILKEVSPEYSLEGLMLKLKLQFFGHLMWKTDSLEKTLILGNTEGRRRRGQQRMRWSVASPIWWTWVWESSRSWWWIGKSGMLQSMGLQIDMTDWLNWTDWYI